VRRGLYGSFPDAPHVRRTFERRTQTSHSTGPFNQLAAWLALVGLLVPSAEVQFYIGNAKLTFGRLCILLLLLPAGVILLQRFSRPRLPDFLATATASWIVLAGAYASDANAMSSSVAEAIEFVGGYIVARAFFFGPVALRTFFRVLKIAVSIEIMLATADSLSGRLIIHDTFASFLNVASVGAQYRGGIVRAASTLDHAIHLGAFCSVVGIILLYSERQFLRRWLWVGICFYGCVLSWSSSGLMSFLLALGAYKYDRLMKYFSWRWSALWAVVAVVLCGFFTASNNPMSWIVSHLTLDPESGFFRFLIWDAASGKISESPWFGFGFQPFHNEILDTTVDSIWLVLALRFGLPASVLLMATNISAALLPLPRNVDENIDDEQFALICTGFTMVLVMFMFVGLTVHYWNYLWIFWGICIGIRASLSEYASAHAHRLPRVARVLGGGSELST
jgi:O-Antigen ligase